MKFNIAIGIILALGLGLALVAISAKVDKSALTSKGFEKIALSDAEFRSDFIEASTKFQKSLGKREFFVNVSKVNEAWRKKGVVSNGAVVRPIYFASFKYFSATGPGRFIEKSGNSSFTYVSNKGPVIEEFNGKK